MRRLIAPLALLVAVGVALVVTSGGGEEAAAGSSVPRLDA
jgi:hypothetical protein